PPVYTLLSPSPKELEAMLAAAKCWPLSTPVDPLRDAPEQRWNQDRYEVQVEIPAEVTAARVFRAVAEIVRTLSFFPRWMVVARRGDTVIVGARVLGLLGIFADRVIAEHEEGEDASGNFDVGFTYA